MRREVFLGAIWPVLVIVVALFLPWSLPVSGCWRLVDPPADCLNQLADANDRVWWTQTVPLLLLSASGYDVVGLMAIRRRRRSFRPPGP